jgi:hypothetical protein
VGYGLGLFVADYNGRQVYWHTGGAAGMVSNVCFVPEEQLGLAILTNNDNQSFFEALRHQLLDAFLDVPYSDRSASSLEQFRKDMKDQLELISEFRGRVGRQKPALPLSAYGGDYTNSVYGSLTITAKNDSLVLKFSNHPDLTGTLQHMDNGEWLLTYNNIEYGIFNTSFKMTGKKVVSLALKVNDFVEYDLYTFTKR